MMTVTPAKCSKFITKILRNHGWTGTDSKEET